MSVPPGTPPPNVPRPAPGRAPRRSAAPIGSDPSFWGPGRPRALDALRDAVAVRVDDWRDRFGGRRFSVGVGAVGLAVVAVVVGLVWYRIGVAGGASPSAAAPHTVRVPATGAAGSSSGSGASGSTVTSGTTRGRGPAVLVHVAGAVVSPGVVSLPTGSRVVDALARAGGAQPDADLDRLNLAARLLDGQRILVPRIGAAPAPTDGAPAEGQPIDLNSATVAQLDTLPGIGPTLAGAIVAERERRGGFRSVDELGEVHGIGPARLADLRERVAV